MKPMDDPHRNLIAALEGDRPAVIPFTVNEQFVTADPAWKDLFAAGLCVVDAAPTVRPACTQVERKDVTTVQEGRPVKITTWTTSVGQIRQVAAEGWVQEYPLKTPDDYRVMTYIVDHTRMEVRSARFEEKSARWGSSGLVLVSAGRTPMQRILVDFAGLENFSYHLAEGFPELFALAESLLRQLIRTCELIAAGPGRYISLLENLTAETWGPDRFARFHVPVYDKILPILHAGGKKVYAHFDGKLASLAPQVARSGLDGVESLTPPPEGDMTYAEARAALPTQFIWGNLNVSRYALEQDRLKALVQDLVRQASPDGRRLALEISEDLPANWPTSIPVVLDALRSGL